MSTVLNQYLKVLGFDPGYGDIKESKFNEAGEIVNRKYSSIVAEASPAATDMPLFEGKRYYVGQEALYRSSDEIIEINDYMNLEKNIPLFLWKTIKDNKIDLDSLEYIVTGLSFSQIDKGADFVKRLSKFKINEENFNLSQKILLTPQGVGAKYAIDYYFRDQVPQTYMIVDIGFSTIDTVDVIEGKIRKENVHGYKDEGIIRIARTLQNYISEKFKDHVSLKEVKEILETKKYIVEGEEHDLTDVIKDMSIKYTEVTINNLRTRFSREFKKYKQIFFVGGGAYFIDKNFSKIISILEEPEYYNSVGNLLKGIEVLNNK